MLSDARRCGRERSPTSPETSSTARRRRRHDDGRSDLQGRSRSLVGFLGQGLDLGRSVEASSGPPAPETRDRPRGEQPPMPTGTPSGHTATAPGSSRRSPPAGRYGGRLAGCPRRCAAMAARRVTDRLLSQVEAARLAGCSRDTIVRARRSGRLPGARLEDGQWAIPTSDLIAAGLHNPPGPGDVPSPPAAKDGPADSEHAAVALARAEVRIAGLEALVARQDDELRFLRLTVETLATRGAA